MNYDMAVIVSVLIGACGIPTLCALGGAILAIQLMHRNGRKMHYNTFEAKIFRDFIPQLRVYQDDGWHIDAVVASEVIKGTVDIQISKYF